jgi:tRNA (guanine9-N1)-methyltransferase
VALTVTSFTGTLEAFANHMGAAAWPFNRHQASLLELFSPDQLILLSPDAAEPLEQLDPAKAYVIGGIVDKTVQKNLTRDFARDQQIPAYRLPIKEHAQQLGLDLPGASTRPVLTAADVVTALLEFNRAQDWVFALQAAVPQRKRRLHRGL